MIRKSSLAWGIAAISCLSILSSCSDDDEPKIAGISFESGEQEVTESDGTPTSFHPDATEEGTGKGRVITAKLVFERALEGEVVLKYSMGGSARARSSRNELNDFEIVEKGENVEIDNNEITIAKGATEVFFSIRVYEDLLFEYLEDTPVNQDGIPYETVEITLESVASGPAKLGTQLTHTIKILEDDVVALMQWAAQDMTAEEAAVDMDLIFWHEGTMIWGSFSEGTEFEGINIPAGLPEGNYGVSYTYYSGNSEDLDFAAAFFTTAGKLNNRSYTFPDSDPLVFRGTYTKANINEYSETSLPKIIQTMVKDKINFSNFSNINIDPTSSRIAPSMTKLDPSVLKKIGERSRLNTLKGFTTKR